MLCLVSGYFDLVKPNAWFQDNVFWFSVVSGIGRKLLFRDWWSTLVLMKYNHDNVRGVRCTAVKCQDGGFWGVTGCYT